MSAVSASLKIDCTSLKSINLPTFHFGFKQNAFSRFVSPIFLTLTSQGGNQGIANAIVKNGQKSIFAKNSEVEGQSKYAVLLTELYRTKH